jgi:hypothetical protein
MTEQVQMLRDALIEVSGQFGIAPSDGLIDSIEAAIAAAEGE